MHQMFRLLAAAIVAVAFTHLSDAATAQGAVKQIKLTDKHVEGFIAAHKDMAAASDKGGDKVDAELGSIAKKNGFASLEEYDEVEANILMIVDGLDPKSKAFTEPPAQIKQRIEELKADKAMPAAEKKQMMDELTEALKTAKPVQFRENIELIKKNFDKIDAALK